MGWGGGGRQAGLKNYVYVEGKAQKYGSRERKRTKTLRDIGKSGPN